MDVVIFGRVSTLIQDYDRQVNELTDTCKQRGWAVRSVFTEKISGAKKNAERKELSRMLDYIRAQHIDKVLVTELSRLGRDTLQVLQVIETLNEDGKVNAMSQFLITILAEIARMERKTIRERMNSGYKNFREQGGVVGRKQGYTKSDEQMKQQYSQEIKLLRKGLSLREVSKLTGHSVNTIRKVSYFV